MSLRKFEILEMIAKGGMAEVYRAQTAGPEGFAKELCVKKILPHLTEDEKFVNMFINEAKLAASLSFANIVSVHDLCVSANREYFIVMEYVHGKDLSDIIRAAQMAQEKIPPELVCYIGKEVCRGLGYAHAKRNTQGEPLNIIHRDISPQNILCSFMGEVKITDFGIAKASTNANQTAVGILKGKYGYMSPEQAHGKELDRRSDIFNLGIVLYELLVQERCFAGASDYSTLNLMREAVVTPPSRIDAKVPQELERIILKALSRKPQDRFQSAEEFENALGDFDRHSHASKLANFVHDLFANQKEPGVDRTTGVLNLASVVEPIPEAKPKEEQTNVTPRTAPNIKIDTDKNPVEAEKADKPSLSTSPPKASTASASVNETKAKEKPERKPARLKPRPEEKKSKSKPKVTDKKPVGRKDLKPGWTDLNKVSAGRRGKQLGQLAGLLIIAVILGFGYGLTQSDNNSYEAAFRALEDEQIQSKGASLDVARPVLIETKPAGAKVRIDNNETQKSPVLIDGLERGARHRLELSMEGHKGIRKDFSISDEDFTHIVQVLKPTTTNLVLETIPAGAVVKLDGVEQGKAPLELFRPEGTYDLLIESPKYLPFTKEIRVQDQKTTKLAIKLVEISQAGQVRVESDVPAKIILNGKFAGYTNGSDFLALEPNRAHTVTIKSLTGNRSEKLFLKLKAKERKKVYSQLRPPSHRRKK